MHWKVGSELHESLKVYLDYFEVQPGKEKCSTEQVTSFNQRKVKTNGI